VRFSSQQFHRIFWRTIDDNLPSGDHPAGSRASSVRNRVATRNRGSASTVRPASNKSTLSSPAPFQDARATGKCAVEFADVIRMRFINLAAGTRARCARVGIRNRTKSRHWNPGFASTQSSRTAYYAKIEKGAASAPLLIFNVQISKPRLMTDN